MSPTSPQPPHSPTTPPSPSASPTHSILRRTASLSAPSHPHKKMLRFTQLHRDSDTLLSSVGQNEDVYYHGRTMEEGLYTDRVTTDQRRYLQSDPGTPNFQETADQIRRTLSLASVDSLLLLSANQSERTKFLAEVSRAGRGLVWRDEGEQCLLPQDNERAVVLALKRGLRSFILAFSVRSGINVLLLLFRLLRKHAPKLSLPLLHRTIFGPEPFRFGGMIGTFTFLYTFTLHLLRLAPPLSYFRRRIRAGLWNKTTFGPPEREGNEGERRWQAAAAGAVGSLGLLWESKSRRTGVAQQMFVRGLQASYNQYTPRFGIHIPHGDLLLFGACCGQIMFAFLMSPETIPKEYNNWINSASRVPSFAILANRTQVRQGYIQDALVQEALNYKGITATNRIRLENVLRKIRDGQQPVAVPCGMVHPWCNTCTETNFRRFFAVCRFMLPVYSALHLIPMLVLRRHHVKRDPIRMMARALWGIGRSCSFLGAFVVIYQVLFCARVQALEKSRGPDFMRSLLKRKEVFWALGFTTCLSLLVEEKVKYPFMTANVLAEDILEKKGRNCNVRAPTSPRVCMVWCQKTGLGPSSAFRRNDSGGGGHGDGNGCLQAPTRCHVRDCQKIIIPNGRASVKIIISTEGTHVTIIAVQIVNEKGLCMDRLRVSPKHSSPPYP